MRKRSVSWFMDHSLDPRVRHVVATVHKVIMFQNHSEPSVHADSVLALATTGCLMTQLPEIVQDAVSIGGGERMPNTDGN